MVRVHRGTVVDFDEARGIGAVRTDHPIDIGTEGSTDGPFPFHCVSIVDETRSIDVGAAVDVRIRPGRHGGWEAVDLTSPA